MVQGLPDREGYVIAGTFLTFLLKAHEGESTKLCTNIELNPQIAHDLNFWRDLSGMLGRYESLELSSPTEMYAP